WRLRPVCTRDASGPMASVMIFSTCSTSLGRFPSGLVAWSIAWATPPAIFRPISADMIFSSVSMTTEALLILLTQENWSSAWSALLVSSLPTEEDPVDAPALAACWLHSAVVRQGIWPVSAARQAADDKDDTMAIKASLRFTPSLLEFIDF